MGLHHPPEPAGVENLVGYLVDTGNGQDTGLAIDIVRDSKGTMIWLNQLSNQAGCSSPESLVIDFRRVPPLAKNELLMENCRKGDVSNGGDGLTIAVAAYQDHEILQKIRLAWRVDIKARRLEDISPVGIQCINEGYNEY